MIDKIISNPRQLFLIDGFGALVTAFSLGIVLTRLESYFGMPKIILYPLALAACCFAVYSFSSYIFKVKNWQLFLKIIAIVNLLYCFVTFGLVIYLYEKLSILGLLYFGIEIVIVVTLVLIELKYANQK